MEISWIGLLLFVCLKDSQGKKKTNLSVGLGGDKRDRTADLLNAIQALSQLSYTPIFGLLSEDFCIIARMRKMSSIIFGNLTIILSVL